MANEILANSCKASILFEGFWLLLNLYCGELMVGTSIMEDFVVHILCYLREGKGLICLCHSED